MANNKTRFSVSVDNDLYQWLNDYSQRKGKSKSECVNTAIKIMKTMKSIVDSINPLETGISDI